MGQGIGEYLWRHGFFCVDRDMLIYILPMGNEHGFESKTEPKRVYISIMKMNKSDANNQ